MGIDQLINLLKRSKAILEVFLDIEMVDGSEEGIVAEYNESIKFLENFSGCQIQSCIAEEPYDKDR